MKDAVLLSILVLLDVGLVCFFDFVVRLLWSTRQPRRRPFRWRRSGDMLEAGWDKEDQ